MNHFWPVTCGGKSAGWCAVSGKIFSSLDPLFRVKLFFNLWLLCEHALHRGNMDFSGGSKPEDKPAHGGYRKVETAWGHGQLH